MFGNTNSPSRSALSPAQVLRLFDLYMQGARTIDDDRILVTELCLNADSVLSRIQKPWKKSFASMTSASSTSSGSNEDMVLRQGIGSAYYQLARLFDQLGHSADAQRRDKKAEKWGYIQGSNDNNDTNNSIITANQQVNGPSSSKMSKVMETVRFMPVQAIATISKDIFNHNESPTVIKYNLPDADANLDNIYQLAYCLSVFPTAPIQTKDLNNLEKEWYQAISNNQDEQNRLRKLASDVIGLFINDEIKAEATVAEVVALAPGLDQTQFRTLLAALINDISHNIMLRIYLLEGLAQLMRHAPLGYLDPDDLVSILTTLNSRLQSTHTQSGDHLYHLSSTVSHVLDAMVNNQVKDLKREQLHEPLAVYLKGLKESSDPHLVYQSAYAFQALLHIPDDESTVQGILRRTSAVLRGVFGVVSAVKDMDMNAFMDEISNIQKGLPSVTDIMDKSLKVYKGTTSLYESGVAFRECMEEGLSFSRKSGWYPALRVADGLLQRGELTKFKTLVCEVSCRNEVAFQWGLCQMLGQAAADTKWSMGIRQDAVTFLGEIYRNDKEWGQHIRIKQWIINILRQLSSLPPDGFQAANTLLNDLKVDGGDQKQKLYRTSLQEPLVQFSSIARLSRPKSSHLLDSVQKKPGVEGSLRKLKRRRIDIGNSQGFYVQQYAKASPQASDGERFLLMVKVKEFLDSKQKVMLVQGDSGAGKSTFNRTLERMLWETYQEKHGRIPLFINLPAIDKPEKDLAAKQLRDYGFTDSEIKELKMNRSFVLICDGYDESMQTNNLYVANQLNKAGEWKCQMVISCRSEYLGSDYRDRFQPMDRNHQADSGLFQEAVIVPFSEEQIEDYIEQYVESMDLLWSVEDYKGALKMVPSLQELVKNPFILSMSLEVLPRMVDPSQGITKSKVKRVTLYDQFVEQWLERGKKRLGETLRPEDRRMFRILTDEGFAQNGIKYLTELAIAIYKHQDGNPVVEYSEYKDRGTWKEEYFSKENRRNLLREASPLTRTGNQYRFLHRSILEYCLVRSIFEPQPMMSTSVNDGEAKATTPPSRRQSISSVFSFEGINIKGSEQEVEVVKVDETSPLIWRSFVDEPSILQFLEDRVFLEPVFKQQLYGYVELSKSDRKWRIAAANAMTILVRTGESFIGADLRGIQIPGADVSHGIFEYAQLQGADLREVNLRKCWLRSANLSGAKMAGVQFGEWPLLEADDWVIDGSYSPDGKTLAAVIGVIGFIGDEPDNYSIIVYDTSTWEKLLTLEDDVALGRLLYSPDSRYIASWDKKQSVVQIRDAGSGALVHRLVGHTKDVSCVAYSPSGNDLASASWDDSVRVWDTQTGVLKFMLEGHSGPVRSVAYSPDGKQIATGGGDRILRLWDATSGQQSMLLMDNASETEQIEYSPNGQEIITRCFMDLWLHVWDVGSGQKKFSLEHFVHVEGIQYSPNGKFAASFTQRGIYQWDMQTGQVIHTFGKNLEGINDLKYSPNGEAIAVCGQRNTIWLLDARSGQLMNTFYGHSDGIYCLAYSPNNHQIASFSGDKTIRLWDTRTQQSSHDLHSYSARIHGITSSPDGQQIASRSSDGTVRMWDARIGQSIHTLQCPGKDIHDIKYSPDGQLLASRRGASCIYLWDVRTDVLVHTLELQGEGVDGIYSFDFSPIGHQIACGHYSGRVTIWNTHTGELIRTLHGHKTYFAIVVFSPNGDQIASYNSGGNIIVWKAQSGEFQHEVSVEVSNNAFWYSYIVYTPDSRKIALWNKHSLHWRVWSAGTGGICYEIQFKGSLSCVALSPCSQQMAVGHGGGLVSVGDIETGSILWVLEGHISTIIDIAYSPDGRYIASSSRDMTVRVWDPKSGQCLIVIPCEGGEANTLVWNASKEGHYLVTGCADGSIRMWQIVKENEEYYYHLKWSTKQTVLNANNIRIQDVDGLSQVNRKLLFQRGAIDEQSSSLAVHEAIKNVGAPPIASKTKNGPSQVRHYQEPPTKVDLEADLKTEGLNEGTRLIRLTETSQLIGGYRLKCRVCKECSIAHIISCEPCESRVKCVDRQEVVQDIE